MGMPDSFIWMGLAHITPVTLAIQYPLGTIGLGTIPGICPFLTFHLKIDENRK